MFQTWGKLLKFIVTKGDVVSNIALVSSHVKSFLELVLGFFVFLLFIEHASLSYDSLWSIGGHLSDKRLGVLDFFKLVLNSDLKLENFLSIVSVLNLLNNFSGLSVESSFEKRLSVIKLVRINIWEKLGQLIVAISRISVILNLKVTETEERKSSSVSWRELELI
jgi:hypothetical protein